MKISGFGLWVSTFHDLILLLVQTHSMHPYTIPCTRFLIQSEISLRIPTLVKRVSETGSTRTWMHAPINGVSPLELVERVSEPGIPLGEVAERRSVLLANLDALLRLQKRSRTSALWRKKTSGKVRKSP